jgi:4-hydroxy-4-methyl-2-oxoglutarate aldolase
MIRFTRISALAAALLLPALAPAQLFKLTREQLVELTAQNPFERFPDGRPKIPDSLMERARGMSAEEVWAILGRGGGGGGTGAAGYRNQWDDGWQILHPDKKMIGRAFTVQFMPARPDLDAVVNAKGRISNQTAIDMVQPGDVFVVDLFGKGSDGTIVGDNLFYYLMTAAKANGLVVDGAIRDLEGISEMAMPAYFRKTHPSALTNVTITGINVPVRIGSVTVMPGDMVFGDKEGLYFVPPQFVQQIVDNADVVHIHDEWTRKKFAEGKYKSIEIYSSPKDPALQKEYKEYLDKRLKEIRKQ